MRKVVLLLWLCLVPMVLFAAVGQKTRVRFNHYTTGNGLSSNLIFAMSQDSSGFLWIGTDFGLDRFDGRLFKHFRKDKYTNLYREDLYYVDCFDDGVYVGGFSGMFQKYDRKTDDFFDLMPAELDSLGYSQIKGVRSSEQGDRFLFTNERVFHYDKSCKCFNSRFQAFDSLKSPFISTLYVDKCRRFWVGSINQLKIYASDGRMLKAFDARHDRCGYVTGIVPVADDAWLVSFLNNTLWVVDVAEDKFRIRDYINLPFNSVNKVTKGRDGRFWFATDGDGLWYADSVCRRTVFSEVVPANAPADGLKKIYSVVEGSDGTVWLGTQNSGLWSFNVNEQPSFVYSKDYGFPTTVCTSFMEDGSGNIIVGTDGDGLFSVSPDFKNVSQFHLPCDNVLGINSTLEGVFVSTWGGGLFYYSPLTGVSSAVRYSPGFNPTQMFFHVCEMDDGSIWACSANDDPYVKQGNMPWVRVPLKDPILPDMESKWTTRVLNASGASKWIVATNLLWLFDGKTPHVVHPELYVSKTHNPFVVIDAACDSLGNLFVLSNHGVLRFSADSLKIDTLSFLPNDSYRTIVRDDNGNFWVAAANGIFSFNYQEQTYFRLPGQFPDLFYYKSGYKDASGCLYFGTTQGFYSFNPDKVERNRTIRFLSLADLYVSKEKISCNNPIILDGDLSDLRALELRFGMTDIDLRVDLVDYSDNALANLRYRLKGLSDVWTMVGDNRVISFNYIPTGNYVLEVEASYSDSKVPLKRAELIIKVLPPWWNTWWFRLLLLLLAGTALFFPLHKKIVRLKKEQDLLKDEIDEQSAMLDKSRNERQKLVHALVHDLHNPLFAVAGNGSPITDETSTEEIVELVIDKALLDDNLLLLVGVDQVMNEQIKTMLSNYVRVKVASTWSVAADSEDPVAPDIIVCDLDGIRADELSRMLSSNTLKHIPILFVSDKNGETDRLIGLICGAVDFIAKPFNQLELLLKLTNILKVKQEQQKVILQQTMTNKLKNMMDNSQQDVSIHPFLQAFADAVKDNYQDCETSLLSLSSALAVSKPTMNRKIKALTGKTPMEWLMEYRLNKALQLLQDHNGGMNISEVAYEVGFSDPSYFTKKFRDHFGILPSQVN